MLIVDAHLDLAMNAIEWNRDLTRPIDEIRAREAEIASPGRHAVIHRAHSGCSREPRTLATAAA